MPLKRTLAPLALAGAVGLAALPGGPALADGAASTRNIILGGAAATAATLIIINHNRQVHEREDAMARAQADADARANDASAAYAAERRAYQHQVAINGEYRKEVALQHQQIVQLRRQLASETNRADRLASNAKVTRVSDAWGVF